MFTSPLLKAGQNAFEPKYNLEITGILRVVLIGPDGNILAEGAELRGGALQSTLERVLK
ncbi:MAG: hypothetical protein ABJB66_12820 [Gemmatimonadaceae bacterium]